MTKNQRPEASDQKPAASDQQPATSDQKPEGNKLLTKILRLTTFLGLQKSTIGMLFMVILVGMGERMAERFLPIYLIALGGGLEAACWRP